MLPSDVALNRTDAHEVVPAANGEARYVHSVEKPCAVLFGPVAVVSGVLEPFSRQLAVVLGDSRYLVHRLEPFGASGPAYAIALVVEAQSGVDHVLRRQMRRLCDGEKVLGEPSLRTSERPDLSGRPRLCPQPFHQVISILQRTPAQPSVPVVLSHVWRSWSMAMRFSVAYGRVDAL